MKTKKTLWAISLVHFLTAIVLSGGVTLTLGARQGVSCALSSALIGVNLWLLAWAWAWILSKKSVALGLAVIVTKYAALLVTLVVFVKKGWAFDTGFMVGLGSLFPTVGYIAVRYQRELNKNDSL